MDVAAGCRGRVGKGGFMSEVAKKKKKVSWKSCPDCYQTLQMCMSPWQRNYERVVWRGEQGVLWVMSTFVSVKGAEWTVDSGAQLLYLKSLYVTWQTAVHSYTPQSYKNDKSFTLSKKKKRNRKKPRSYRQHISITQTSRLESGKNVQQVLKKTLVETRYCAVASQAL